MKFLHLALAVSVLLLASCQVRLDQSTVVNRDGSGVLTVVIAVDQEVEELLAASGQELQAAAESLPAGFVTSEYSEGDLRGITAEMAFADLEELNGLLGGELGGGQVADSVSITRDGDVFKFRAALGDIGEQLSQVDAAGAFISDEVFDEVFDITIRTRLPGEVIEHNADEVDLDGGLRWTISSASSGELSASSSVDPGVSVGVMMVVVGGVAALALGAAQLLSRRPALEAPNIG